MTLQINIFITIDEREGQLINDVLPGVAIVLEVP